MIRLHRVVILCVVVLGVNTARAAPPYGYQCSPGTAKKGVGCACPAGFLERRDRENNALCVRRLVSVVAPAASTAKVDGTLFEMFETIAAKLPDKCAGIDCLRAATKYDNGDGVTLDKSKATALFDQACTAGVARACAELSSHLEYGMGVTPDRARADVAGRRGCDLGDGRACDGLATARLDDKPKAQPFFDKAHALFETECSAGLAEACTQLGSHYQWGLLIAEDKPKAVKLFEQACRDNWADACGDLAWMYDQGYGVAKDPRKALELYEKACNLGDYHTCAVLGTLLPDKVKAAIAYAAGCRHGSGYGCNKLGEWYETADAATLARVKWSTPLSDDVRTFRALQAYSLACQYAAQSEACVTLGKKYRDGAPGVPPDKPRARTLFERACEGGDQGCGPMGEMYEHGVGGSQDLPKALQYYEKACAKYESKYCADRDRMRTKP